MTHREPAGPADGPDRDRHTRNALADACLSADPRATTLVRTEERMTAAVRTLEAISSVLVRTRDDPHELLREVVRAAAAHLHADWTMIALRHDVVRELGVGVLAVGPTGRVVDSSRELPAALREELYRAGEPLARDTSVSGGWVRVPLELDGDLVGRLVGLAPVGPVEHADLLVLQILADQAAMAAERHRITLELHDLLQGLAAQHRSASAMVRGMNAAPAVTTAGTLTSRELEVLRLLARGLSNRAIGRALFISETTAKFHVANIMRKLEVTRRAEAVYVASKMGAV